ncbi:MAG: nucleotidyltransferase family protein [Bdellovibrionota bacterium]
MKVQCVILAGGLATRMRPITETIPKALIPVGDRPFIDYQLEDLARQGVTDIVLCLGYLGQMVRDHVGDGSRFGLRVEYTDEGKELRGTAGAIRLALDQGVLEPWFLILYGDSFLPIRFREVWESFEKSGNPALMTVLRNTGKWDQSNACFDRGMVTLYDKRLEKKPEAMQYIDYGLSVVNRELFEAVPPGVKADLADIFHGLSTRGELTGFEVHERFYEIGSPSGLNDFKSFVQRG